FSHRTRNNSGAAISYMTAESIYRRDRWGLANTARPSTAGSVLPNWGLRRWTTYCRKGTDVTTIHNSSSWRARRGCHRRETGLQLLTPSLGRPATIAVSCTCLYMSGFPELVRLLGYSQRHLDERSWWSAVPARRDGSVPRTADRVRRAAL